MQTKLDLGVKELFNQAVDTWGGAMKASIKFQDDVAKWWTQRWGRSGSLQDIQCRASTMIAEAIPTAQKSAEEALRLVDQNYRTGSDLLRKAMETGKVESFTQVQAKTQEVSGVNQRTGNAQAVAQANMRAMESWADFVRKNVNRNGAKVAAAVSST